MYFLKIQCWISIICLNISLWNIDLVFFLQSKKFILQISAYVKRKCFQFFQENACPCIDYNCHYLQILNKRYYEYIKSINKNKKYSDSILNYFKDDWGQAFFKTTSELSQ